MATTTDAFEIDGFVQQQKELEALLMSNPAMEKKVQALIRKVLMQLINGTYAPNDPDKFRTLYNSLLNTISTSKADTYFILKDFRSYAEAQRKVGIAYQDEAAWAESAILNVASSGKFTSDRTIQQYVDEIWHLDKVVLKEL